MQSFLQYQRIGRVVRRQSDKGGVPSSTTGTALEVDNDHVLSSNDSGDGFPSPLRLSTSRKWTYTFILAMSGFIVSGASAISAETLPQATAYFDVSQEIALLTTALFLIGLGLGSLISAPISETIGRNPVYLICLTIFGLFEVGAALSTTIASQATCRFFAALFGCPPLSTFGGSMSDMWHPIERTYVFPMVSCFWFVGPFMAPVVADFVATSPSLSFKWTDWIVAIAIGANIIAIFLVVPETYGPVLQQWETTHLRTLRGSLKANPSLKVSSLRDRLLCSISRPITMIFTQPILDLFSLYLVIVYIILFGFLPGFSFIFGENGIYGLDQQHTGLCFIPMNVGYLLALIPIRPIYKRFSRKLADAELCGSGGVAPEERLLFAMIGAPFLPVSIFWMGWTGDVHISLWVPLTGSLLFGFAVMCIFISCYQYMIDWYGQYAASALAVMTLTRYLVAGPMVIVSLPMYTNLGVHWSMTLMGCLSLLMTPVPFVFYRYGATIRKRSDQVVGED